MNGLKPAPEGSLGTGMVLAVALSYAIDGLLLAGFAVDGTISTAIPLLYTVVGLIDSVVFFLLRSWAIRHRRGNGDLFLVQVLASSSIQLIFAALAPQLAFYFFTVLFVVFGFGSLGLSKRHSAMAWIGVAAAVAFVMLSINARLVIPQTTTLERVLVWLCFAATLGRCVLLGIFGRALRLRLQYRREQLSESIHMLKQRDESLAHVNLELRRQATHDALTGIANRTLFVENLQRAVHENQPFAVCVFDLDRFKLINDSLGHGAGDALLKQVSTRLLTITRTTDCVARAGGDEFLLLLRDAASVEEVEALIARWMSAMSQPYLITGMDLHVSHSIGIARYPADGRDAEALLARADEAMYFAKRSGRQTHRFFDANLMGSSRERLNIEAELRGALARGQLALHYQPKIDIATGQMRSVEALLRWRHPVRGSLLPLEFIPIAEESGLILEIGEWAIREACRQAREWQQRRLPFLRVAVNVSPLQFRQAYFLKQVSAALAANSLDPSYLEIELTEATLMSHAESSVALLEELSALGVMVAIDDFGTGYSSMSYLQRFPIDKLKIDRSFITDLASNPGDASIVRAIISLAHGLHLKVIAEGVESDEQLSILRRLGCDQYQGFFRSAAVSAAEIEKLSRRQSEHALDRSDSDLDRTQSKLYRLRGL